MSEQILAFNIAFKGRQCVVERLEPSWALSFGDGHALTIETPWRIVQSGPIVFGSSDDGQKFGLSEPLVGAAKANALLKDRYIIKIEVDGLTADLRVYFDGETRIDLFNGSSGFEGWQANYPFEGGQMTIIGVGGGDLAFIQHPKVVQKS